MAAFLIVRAEVDPAVRDAFDAWYQNEHLPEAVEAVLSRATARVALERNWTPNVHIRFLRVQGTWQTCETG